MPLGTGYGKIGYREDIGVTVRSTWEANYCRVLNLLGRKWSYEPRRFLLKNGSSYTPDFKVGSSFVEVKGYVSPLWKKKVQLFHEQYPDVKLKVITPERYKKMAKKYAPKIGNWEFGVCSFDSKFAITTT